MPPRGYGRQGLRKENGETLVPFTPRGPCLAFVTSASTLNASSLLRRPARALLECFRPSTGRSRSSAACSRRCVWCLPFTARARAIPALARRRRRLLQGHCRHLHLRLLPRRPTPASPPPSPPSPSPLPPSLPPSPPPPSPPPLPPPGATHSLASTSEPWPAASPQVIVKEERQLNEPKPVVTVKHVWNPEDLAGRPNTWNREDGTNKDPMRQKPMEDTDKMSVRPLGRTVVVLAPAKLAAYGSRRPHRVAMEPLRASDRYAGSHRGCAFHSALCV